MRGVSLLRIDEVQSHGGRGFDGGLDHIMCCMLSL